MLDIALAGARIFFAGRPVVLIREDNHISLVNNRHASAAYCGFSVSVGNHIFFLNNVVIVVYF